MSKIFSGDESIEFWKAINSTEDENIKDLLYWFGCKCQEIESKVDRALQQQNFGGRSD